MSHLLEVLLGIVLIALLIWALYFAFGPQALGVPALVGVLVVAAGVSVFSNAGFAGLVFVLLGLFVLVMIIGMAMRLGNDRGGRPGPPPE